MALVNMSLIRGFSISCAILFCLFAFCTGSFFAFIHYYRINWSALEHYAPGQSSVVLDASGNEWMQFALDRRQPIEYSHIPLHVVHAFCAAEDRSFFSHSGLSYKGIIRSLLVNMYYGKKMQGASTITQQLVKLLFFDAQKTFSRKIKEQLYAVLAEQQFSKEQILQTYLNHVYFGAGIYGIEAAAQRFWKVSACDLTIAQAALLAGIIRRPEYYCPLYAPLSAKKRRDIVLHALYKQQWINKQEYLQGVESAIDLVEHVHDVYGLHVREMIRHDIEQLLGKKDLYTKGLVIQTTIDSSLQKQAEHIFKEHCLALQKSMNMPIDGGLLAIEPITGEIRAIVGGKDPENSKFNRAINALRQFGSIIKPLIYTAAMEKGRTFAHVEVDEPFSLSMHGNIWAPHNYDKEFHGPLTLAYALSISSNIVAIKTLLDVGAAAVVHLLEKCHVTAALHMYPSLALGCIDGTLIEAVGMFNIFATNGTYLKPHFIRWIKDNLGTKIYLHQEVKENIIPSFICGQVTKVLTHGLKRVRHLFGGKWVDAQAISKTGTTNDSRTCWFMGATPSLTTGVYIGCDDNRAMGAHVFPLRTAFPIWLDVNKFFTHIKKEFVYDPRLKELVIDRATGKPAVPGAGNTITILS